MNRIGVLAILALLAATAHAQVVRTGDVLSVRGFTERDFPRVKKLADHIYAYEEAGSRRARRNGSTRSREPRR